jgi:hypothetical protein
VEHAPEQGIAEPDIVHCAVEARNGAAVHLLVRPIAAVHSHHWRLVATLFAVERRTAPRLASVGRKPLGVLRVEAVAEGMADDRVCQDVLVPGVSELLHSVGTSERFEDGCIWHDPSKLCL